jgi:hypothetical protein
MAGDDELAKADVGMNPGSKAGDALHLSSNPTFIHHICNAVPYISPKTMDLLPGIN